MQNILILKKFLEVDSDLATICWFCIDLIRIKIFFSYIEKRNILSINRGKKFVFTSPNQFMKFRSSVSMWPYGKVTVEERGLERCPWKRRHRERLDSIPMGSNGNI